MTSKTRFNKTVVINVVGLSKGLISKVTTPCIYNWLESSTRAEDQITLVEGVFPAVTCVSQTTYLTGKSPSEHGVIANGFYDKDCCEVRNWHQSAKIIKAQRIFTALKDIARKENGDPNKMTVFSNCWWFPMYDEDIDYLITPRPQYLQNGGKLPDIYTKPDSLRDELQKQLGTFPLHKFWGPTTSIASTQWIADATISVDKKVDPTLSLIYLPHLDYCLQKYGPLDIKTVPNHLREVDRVVGQLIKYYEKSHPTAKIILLSEYGISPVQHVIYPNKILRESGYISVRRENYGETLDCGASRAFAMADHQVAHVFVKNKSDIPRVKQLFAQVPGIDHVLDAAEQDAYYGRAGSGMSICSGRLVLLGPGTHTSTQGAYHSQRSGDVLLVSDSASWFAYYYWKEEAQAPDFARCVAIHRKPGYDPAEMFFRYNPPILGMLYLFFKIFLVYVLRLRLTVDATPLKCDMIRGSHGALPKNDMYKPVYITKGLNAPKNIRGEDVYNLLFTAVTK